MDKRFLVDKTAEISSFCQICCPPKVLSAEILSDEVFFATLDDILDALPGLPINHIRAVQVFVEAVRSLETGCTGRNRSALQPVQAIHSSYDLQENFENLST